MAQPCSYIYPIYSVVKHHRQALLTSTPWGAGHNVCPRIKPQACTCRLNLIQNRYLSRNGGADRDRTDDILLAKQALSQLSYSPISNLIRLSQSRGPVKMMVGLGRLELPTSPLSGVRSSQLSYRPRSLAPAFPFGPADAPAASV